MLNVVESGEVVDGFVMLKRAQSPSLSVFIYYFILGLGGFIRM